MSSTTVRSRRINGVRPLRPGPRLNIGTRGRTTSTEPPVEDHVTGDEEPEASEPEIKEKVRDFKYLIRFRQIVVSPNLISK